MAELSIRKQLLFWLLIPLCSLLILGALFAHYLAYAVSNYTYDRALLSSADSVAARLRWKESGVIIDLPPAAQAVLRYSHDDKVYYQVLRQDGKRISGDAVITGPIVHPESAEPRFRDGKLNGAPIRIVRVRAINPHDENDAVLVQVAETLTGRTNLTRLLFISIVGPQILLILLGSLAVWFGIGRGLTPVKKIQQAVQQRSRNDLSPLVFDAVPVEIKPLVEAINSLLERLRAEIEAQRRFVANAAHQLRTPLAGLRTYTGLSQRIEGEPHSRQLFAQIDLGIDRMVHLVNRLLSLARAEPTAEKGKNHAHIDLNFIASDATAELVETALAKDVELTFESAAQPALVSGNKEALRDLATNLIENAVIYTQPGGTVTVRVSNGSTVDLVVEDNGPGIPPEERSKVFERFYRILGSDVQGSGLGLSIVREVATAHDAAVALESGIEGRGVSVKVSFPVLPKERQSAA